MPNFIEIARNVAEIWCFWIFQDGGRRHLEFLKFRIFNGRARHECRTASACQNFVEIVRTATEICEFQYYASLASKCLFTSLLGFLWHISPNDVTHRPNPKKDHPWAEPRHLRHKPRIFCYWFLNGPYKSPLFLIGLTLWGPRNVFWGF